MAKSRFLILSIVFISLFRAFPAVAWQVQLDNNPYLPESFIGVSKQDRRLYLLEATENFNIANAFASIHGEVEGPKELEGDLRTPEGVYFVTTQIRMELDFEEYGSGAYALNYPNPIDIIRERTGYGIWIHSKGSGIAGQNTQGCVAVDLDDFAYISDYLPNGTPVVLANDIYSPLEELVYIPSEHIVPEVEVADLVQDENLELSENNLESERTAEALYAFNAHIQPSESTGHVYVQPRPRTLPYTSLYLAQTISGVAMPMEEILAEQASQAEALRLEQEEYLAAQNALAEAINEVFYVTPIVDNSSMAEEFVQMTMSWNEAWANRSEEFFNFYNPNIYGLAQNESYEQFRSDKEYLFSTLPWIQITYGDIYALEGTDYWVTWFEQLYRASNVVSEGTRRLYWQQDESGEYKIVAMEWIPANLGLEEAYIASITPDIESVLEEWRTVWLEADVEAYRTFYTANAVQDSRRGDEIFEQKSEIWAYKQPTEIIFDNVEISSDGSNIRVSMTQEYTDSSGYSDYGRKTVYFTLENEKWRIVREEWRRI